MIAAINRHTDNDIKLYECSCTESWLQHTTSSYVDGYGNNEPKRKHYNQ